MKMSKSYRSRKPKRSIRFPLEDKIFCEYCHELMQKDSLVDEDANITYCYSCKSKKEDTPCNNKSVRKEWIEQKVAETIVENFLTDENIQRLTVGGDTYKEKLEAKKSVCQSQLEEINAEMRDIVDDMTKDIIPDAKRDHLNELEAQRSELQKSINEINLEMRLASSEDMRLLMNVYKSMDPTYLKDQILLIKTFVDFVSLNDSELTIFYRYFGDSVRIPLSSEDKSAFEIDAT